MGKRAFSHKLLNPSTNIDKLQIEYDMTDYILKNYDLYESCFKYRLTSIKDIAKLTRQILMKKLAPKMLVQIYKDILLAKELFIQLDSTLSTYLTKTIDNVSNVPSYCDQITQFLDYRFILHICEEEDNISHFDTNFIKSGINNELDIKNGLLMDSNDKLEAIRTYLNETVAKYEKKSVVDDGYVKIHETEKNMFRLISTKRRCHNLKKALEKTPNEIILTYNLTKTFIFYQQSLEFTSQTAANDSISSPQILELCKNITNVKIQIKDLINDVYISILQKMEPFQPLLETIIQFITSIDVLFAKATLAKKFNYCKPIIVSQNEKNKSFVEASGLRHCLIEHIQQNEIYVANSISLNEERRGILLYGTNAVGKTSFIRALGIAVIMAQAGLYVPCSDFHFYPYKTLFTRILGNDNIFKGLSTFAVEMSELRIILRLANDSSLILGDELCSGTESISAISIFVAGIKQLAERNSSFIFATHLHEIIHYEEIISLKTVTLNHMAVVYNTELDTLVYDRKLKDGPGENMYGLEVCKSLHLPRDFLDLAHQIRMKYFKTSSAPLSLNTSHFNSKKIVGLCEMCHKEMGTEVHHLQHQQMADESGSIIDESGTIFHKNHPANLLTVCETCHDSFHKKGDTTKKVKKVKTGKGFKII